MAWGGLNPALTSWRNGLMARFSNKDTRTDGARADQAHGSNSEHQADSDGTVDAYDCDVNWLRSGDPDGNAVEDRISEAVKADFMADRRSRLWIHNRQIANKNVQNGTVRFYGGASPHTEHIHFEAIQALEDDGRPWAMPRTDALLRELEEEDMALSSDDKRWLSDEMARQIKTHTGPATWNHTEIDPLSTATPAGKGRMGGWARMAEARAQARHAAVLASIGASGGSQVDESAIVAGILAGLTPQAIAAAIPAELAEQVAQNLADRLAA